MENNSSSSRSREIDDVQSWDDQQQPPPPAPTSFVPHNHRVKLMCSYGGKIQPRPHDNQLSYTGGETKILAVDRTIKYSIFVSKLVSLCGGGGGESDICFKYQLPGEDLDALISVTNDEDLEHLMLEYDRLSRRPGKQSARLRLFLFRMNNPRSFPRNEVKSDQQWFVDVLNSTRMPILEGSPTPAPPAIPDFLFGFDKQPPPPVAEVVAADPSAGREGRVVIMDLQSLKTGDVSHEEVVGVKKDQVFAVRSRMQLMGVPDEVVVVSWNAGGPNRHLIVSFDKMQEFLYLSTASPREISSFM